MTNSEEGKKILDVLRGVREAHVQYTKLPASNIKDERLFILLEQSLEEDHKILCCGKCYQYNDECRCN